MKKGPDAGPYEWEYRRVARVLCVIVSLAILVWVGLARVHDYNSGRDDPPITTTGR